VTGFGSKPPLQPSVGQLVPAKVENLRFGRLIKNLFGVRAIDPGQLLAPDIQASFELGDPSYRPEERWSRGERLWSFSVCATVGSGVNASEAWQLSNPLGSNRLLVVKRVRFRSNGTTSANQTGRAFAYVTLGAGTGGLTVYPLTKDGRALLPSQQLVTASAFAQGGSHGQVPLTQVQVWTWSAEVPLLAAQTAFDIEEDQLDVVAPPNVPIVFGIDNTVAPTAGWTYSFRVEGYERVLEPNELTGPP